MTYNVKMQINYASPKGFDKILAAFSRYINGEDQPGDYKYMSQASVILREVRDQVLEQVDR